MPRFRFVLLARLTAVCLFALCAARAADPINAVYAAITSTQSYSTFVGPTPIDGLSVNLPAATPAYNAAIVTLSMPNLYLSAPTSDTITMTANIQLVAPFSPKGVISVFGSIGCDTPRIATSAKKPLTMVLRVPLGASTQFAEAEWDAEGNTVTTDTFASISAILVRE